ncbi:hypothetical protein CHLNCDRAFT_137610 [Chlorella variabilis]|uniref:THO complex subunit 5 n=1 Tax=Chlorella variabilis TaxID=554065 RepID=E1Z433_CHLVA|nr:hypothetical protein CHLNCDRAFT_137610 [Chlorella variabilis]EFN59280.1 hypothetical protein CHLNCDRAFT_137610 [Chlorella variabilis]|eukprot:XP_005851382.1 hypothetical protein CHLNCDRAFT_137610 [Chlorella variabilis]
MEVAIESEAPLAVGEFFDALVRARRDEALPDDPQQVFSSGACKLLELKAAHRRLCENTDALREAASEAKSQLDDSSLQLQNLLYERQHYEKEIGSCRGWRSAYSDEQIALVPLEEFAALCGELAAEEDPHKLMLNRLAHEVSYRRQFLKKLEGIKAQRDALAADVAQKRSTVAGLEGEVGKLLATAQAVQQQYAITPADGPAAAAANGGEAVEQAAAAAAGDVAMQDA